jgi:hypothetical protein
MRSAVLRPTPGIFAGENFQRQRRPDAGSGEEHLEKMLFPRGDEAVECERVLADVRVNEKSDLGMKFAESGVGGKRDLDKVPNAADIDEHLIRAFFGEASAKLANHRRQVLPPFVRLSTRSRESISALPRRLQCRTT